MGLKRRVDRLEEIAQDDEVSDLPRVIIEVKGRYYAGQVRGNEPLSEEEIKALESKDKYRQILWVHIHDPRTTAKEQHGG